MDKRRASFETPPAAAPQDRLARLEAHIPSMQLNLHLFAEGRSE
jgi:hypothetical protein